MEKVKKKKTIGSVLSSAKKWIKGYLAKDKRDVPLTPSPIEKVSVKYCLLGAVIKVFDNNTEDFYKVIERMDAVILRTKKWKVRTGGDMYDQSRICNFNNHEATTYADIRELIKKAKV